MDTIEFIAVVTAVLCGNALTVGFLIGLWHADKDIKKVTFPMWIGMLVPPFIVIGVAKFLLT